MPGLLITFEGGEGAGKTTQIARIGDALESQGLSVLRTREPGGTPSAEALRTLVKSPPSALSPMAEALVFAAARADHVANVIKPALDKGFVVLCDRFIDSTRAYQSAGGGLAMDDILTLEHLSCGDLKPDLTIIFDQPIEDGLARAHQRGPQDSFEARDLAYHQRLRQAFLDIAAQEPDRCQVIDASLEVAAVSEHILAGLRPALQTLTPEGQA